MKNKWLRLGSVGVLVAVLAVATLSSGAFAAAPAVGPAPWSENELMPPEPGEQQGWSHGPLAMGGLFGPGPRGDEPWGPEGDGPLGFGGLFGPGVRGLVGLRGEADDVIAATLGMTVDELRDALKDKTLAEIAKEKNVHMADIQAAVQNAREQELQRLVEEGKLTQKQADLLTEKMGRWNLGDLGTRLLFDGFDKLQSYAEQMRATLAQTLNMSVDELAAALKEKSLYEIAKEKNVHVADIQEAMRKARQDALQEWLQQAVADGLLTQEQADLIGARAALRQGRMWREFVGGDFGLRGEMKPFRRMMDRLHDHLFDRGGWHNR
jgi:2C-methyl-D-erythritol 2,4-cyclodiphosphate synthase